MWTECLFADPVADIAILGGPDDQSLPDYAEAYEDLTDRAPLIIGDAPKHGREREPLQHGCGSFTVETSGEGAARLLSLDGPWIECRVERWRQGLRVVEEGVVASGMSGSPIMMANRAISLMSTGGLNPVLKDCLPAWFLRR